MWDSRSRQFETQPPPVSGATVRLPALEPGAYQAQFTDPWTGASLGTAQVQHPGGPATVNLPLFSRDIALKMVAQ